MNKILPPRSKEDSANLITRLDMLVRNADKTSAIGIKDYELKHQQFMSVTYGRFIEQFETFYSMLIDYSNHINYLDKKWPTNRGFQYVIATHSLKQFHTAFVLLKSGFYADSTILLRSVYESFLRIVFVSCHPDYPHNAFKMAGQTGPKFQATSMVNSQLGLKWTTYSTMSVFAHSNQYDVMGDMIEIDKKKPTLIAVKFEADNDMASLTMNMMNFLLAVNLKMYDELFIVDISLRKDRVELQRYIDLLHEYALITNESLKGHDKNTYWRQVGVDIENIFTLVKTMDSNSNLQWTKVWKTIVR